MLTRGKAYELSTDRSWKLRLFLWQGQREGWDEKTMDVNHRYTHLNFMCFWKRCGADGNVPSVLHRFW